MSDGRLLDPSEVVQGFVFSLVLGVFYFAEVGREVAVAGVAAQQGVTLFCGKMFNVNDFVFFTINKFLLWFYAVKF